MTETASTTSLLSDSSLNASEEFVGRWNELISTTNWDKGRIICDWREALVEADAPATEYSDEAWSQLVGNVTPQHVGRLRRVHQRFDADRVSFEGLYWSHFCAALEWEDAEMWLEGALQNRWSVSKMRRQRWETLGSIPADEPQAADVVSVEPEEEQLLTPQEIDDNVELPPELTLDREPIEVEATAGAPELGLGDSHRDSPSSNDSARIYSGEQNPVGKFVQSFETIDDLPSDLSEAFDQYKQVILRHKEANWEEVSKEDMLASLESLKAIVMSA